MNETNNQYVLDALQNSVQQSRAWDKVRLGRFTGSGISALMTEPRTKADKEAGKWSQTAETYIVKKAMEEATGMPIIEVTGRAVDHGNEWEEHALRVLQKAIGCPDEKAELKPPFKLFNEYSGASPDAFMYYKPFDMMVGVEIKCPFNPINHFWHSQVHDADSLKDMDSDYYWQVQMNMMTFNIPYWIFASFDPRQNENRMLSYSLIRANVEDMEILCQKIELAYKHKQSILSKWNSK
jgi:hypothetical protein